ncbi:3-deoxy-manno-octulosonate cytidylyltransferase [Photobacterium halotolerans]|uniref:3-deoxy-manno-octulosonate cytidylyltransferase n=1 Tax=Photobacterium halotolerans TaxID=265726 RepID=UPI0013735C87|nr:3-deoxy-manno-octulosonate cytidylyltransferase [Photobacterium halotolerans]NAX48083.1 3-deoxy-manno-octulosonate cytidylyltransferase [Photobacterium halotolerans]
MNKIKIVIPARYSSSRLPGKPLLEINKRPMFWHVAQRCIEAGVPIGDIVIATDDERIFNSSNTFSIPVVMTSNEHQSGTDRINEVASILQWSSETLVVNVQGDEPLISPDLIKQVIGLSVKKSDFDIFTAIKRITSLDEFKNPNVVKAVIGNNNRALYFTRSASPYNRDDNTDFSFAFRHVGIYAYTVKSLYQFCSYPESNLEHSEKLEQLRALSNGMTIAVTEYDGDLAHGVDTLSDFHDVKRIIEGM